MKFEFFWKMFYVLAFLIISVHAGMGCLFFYTATTFNIALGMGMSALVMVVLISQQITIELYQKEREYAKTKRKGSEK